jgi:tripartite-type tricarboxylate transporter receptor subunit TctC
VPYSAGGGSDISARLLAKDLEPLLGKPVTVENRVGGGGWIGWGSLAASRPDGYTIGYINAPSMFAGYLDKSLGSVRKENLESFTPLINHVVDPNMWAVRPDSKYKSVHDVIEDGKKRPGMITFTCGGHGTDDHIALLGIEAATGAKFQVVHFRGTAEGKTAALGGHVDIMALNVGEVAEDIKAGQIRALGVMATERTKFIPNAPTFRELGLDQVWAVSRGVAGPANLAKDVEAALISAMEKAILSPEHRKKAEALALEPRVIKGAEYRKFLKDNEQATKKLMNW